MSFSAKILADSISPDEVRLVTMEVIFPRFILAEFNTHRMLSRNSASSRAIPTEKHIERAMKHPFVPVTFNRRVKGMGVGEELGPVTATAAESAWLTARDHAVIAARRLMELDVDKSRVNRLLEPFMWHTAIVSATEWSNFFALRDHPAAQPEFQIVAKLMREAMDGSQPKPLAYGQWHLPLVSAEEKPGTGAAILKRMSASRCARVSYDRHADEESREATLARADKLFYSVPPHLSPAEHVARPVEKDSNLLYPPEQVWSGNFRGWVQYRKEIPYEDDAAQAIAAVAS